MGVDTSTVQIRINVVDDTSGPVIAKTTQNIQQLGNAGAGVRAQISGTAQSFQSFGVSGTIAGRVVKQNMEEAGASVQETRERAHLAAEEFGIHLPRAFRSIIAESKLAQTALAGVGSALVGLGAIQIGFIIFDAIAEGAKKVWEMMTGLSKGTQDYLDQVEKTREDDFGNTHSIETTRMRIDEATEAINRFQNAAEEAQKKPIGARSLADLAIPGAGALWQQFHGKSEADDANDQAAKLKAQRDKLEHVQEATQFHEGRMATIEILHGKDAELSKEQQITAEFQKRKDIAAETRRYTTEQDRILGNPVSAQSGAEDESVALAKAREAQDVAAFNLRKEQIEEIARLREDALEASLRGEDVYRAKEQFEIDELARKQMSSPAAIDAIRSKYHAEQMRRLEDETRAVQKLEREAGMASLTGMAKTQAEGAGRVTDIRDVDFADVDKRGHSVLADRERAAAQKQTDAELAAEQKTFAEQVDAIIAQSQARQIGGFARIRAEAGRAADDLQRQFDKAHELMDVTQPDAQQRLDQDTTKLGAGLDAIAAGADRQTADLNRRNTEETEQLESEARSKHLSAERQQTAAIETEYEQRLNKFREQLEQQAISEDDYNRRVVAAGELRDAELVESARRAREKMAGEFTRFFSNPKEALKELGNKAAGEAAAAMVQRVQGRFSGASQMPTGAADGGGMWDKVMTRIAGAPAAGQHGISAPHNAASDLTSIKAITLATAEIHVQSANVSFSSTGMTSSIAAGAAGSTAARSGSIPGSAGGGSTSLLGMPGSAFNAPGGSTASPSGFGGGTVGSGGGAGDSGFASGGNTLGIMGGAGSAPASKNAVGNALGDVQQGVGLFKQAKSIFSPGASPSSTSDSGGGLGDSGMPDLASIFGKSKTNVVGPSGAGGGMLGGGGIMANAGGAAGGAMGLFAAYQGNGGVGGALGGAMSGMELGMAVGGPIGAAVGLVGGAILGAIGLGGREKARVYDLKTVRPRIGNDMMAYQAGSMDYTSAYSDMQSLDAEARKTLDAMGGSAKAYYWDTINHEIKQAEGKLTAEQRAGRSQYTAQAAQYDQGGWTGNFGAMATGSESGWAHMRANEFVVHEQPAAEHAGALEAIRAGASHADMAAYYGGGEAKMPAQSGFGGDVHLHVHALDTKTALQAFRANKHELRSVINESYAENSGGSDA